MTRYKKQDPEITRRKFINTAFGATAAVGGLSLLTAVGAARPAFRLTRDKMPPMEGDILIHAEGDKVGQPVKVADLSEKITRAWPQGKAKDGSPLLRKGEPNNLLAVYRFPKGQIEAPTVMDATIDGEVVAYSDICTHAGCSVEDNKAKAGSMNCPCHSGQYDPKRGCTVIGGPPPRGLSQLPIKLEGDQIVATGFFLAEPWPYGFASAEAWKKYTEAVEALL